MNPLIALILTTIALAMLTAIVTGTAIVTARIFGVN